MRFYHPSEKAESKDYSGIGILISNCLVIVFALIENWSLGPMMIIYWAQSVIIGIFHFFRILCLRKFCTEGFTSNGKRVAENASGKRSTAFFFAVHYGFFHLGYLVFLIGFAGESMDDAPADENESAIGGIWMLVSVLGFLIGHGYSFYRNVRADMKNRPNLGTMMFLPYARVIPMHLTIIFGNMFGSNRVAVLLFSLLKTGADYLMHIVEHRILQKPRKDDA